LEPALPADVLHFIRECIDRLETLDVLLFLQAGPERVWTVPQVANEMRSSTLAISGVLETLHRRGLLSREGEGFRFRPREVALKDATARLAICYREKRTAVITAVFSQPSGSVRHFAEAFRFKKGKSDG
jgi:hypothetical protein